MNNSILNIWSIFNHNCPLCDSPLKGTSGPCLDCLKDLPYQNLGCDICALPGVSGLCKSCQQQRPNFSRVFAGFTYRFPLPQLLHRVKKSGDPEPLHWLAKTVAERLREQLPANTPLLAVPMHPIDQLLRGFNQSQVLAQVISQQLGFAAPRTLLHKIRRTEHQAQLNRAQRKANLEGCFELSELPPKRLILIDDVVTTGTTAQRITELLQQAGTEEVYICTLCRTPD